MTFSHTAMTLRLRHRDMMLLVGLCLITLLHGVGNLSLQPAKNDGRQNLVMGIQLGQEPNRPSHHREPFVPAVIAAVTLAQRALGFEPVAGSCVDRHSERVGTFQCRSAYAPYKILNVVFLLVAGVCVFFLCWWYAEVRWLPYIAFLLVTQSLLGLRSFDRFYTEVPAAALVVMVSCLSVLTLVRRRVLYSALLGLALAALVLTKTVFLYFWPFVVAGLVASDLLQRTLGRRTMLLVGVFLVVHFLPTGGWMVRNFVLFDEFSVVDSWRTTSVLTLRAAYNTMRDDEFAAGFWYYTPYKLDLGVPKHSYERLMTRNANGFKQMGRRARKRLEYQRKTQENELLRARIFAEPWRHLKISTLMAWRGLFVQHKYGSRSSHVRVLRPGSLPRELLPAAMAVIKNKAHVVWFRERETVDGYGEADLKELLNLETVAEFSDSTLYRMPPPVYRMPPPVYRMPPPDDDDLVKRATRKRATRLIPRPATPAVVGDCEDWTSEQFFASATVEEVVACLNSDANPNVRNNAGGTALHLAARFNPSGVVIGALLDAGADLHLRDNPGRAPLHLAAWQNPSVAVIKALLDAGADPNVPNDRGFTPLSLAAGWNSQAVVEALLDAGADPNVPNDRGFTPLSLAAERDSQAVVEALLDAGALPGAGQGSETRVFEFLGAAGADAAQWSKPTGMLYHFREWPFFGTVLSNHVPSLPSLEVAVPRLADVWGLDFWPRWGWTGGPISNTLVNLVGFLALLVVPLWFWFGRRRRRIEVVFVVLPALYLHAVYAVASHFIPRYAEPEVPLRIWATLLLVCLMASSVRRLGGMLVERRVSTT